MRADTSIKERLESEIKQQGFVAYGLLPKLCSVQDIRLLLNLAASDSRPEKIHCTSLKLFLILVLFDQFPVILACLDQDCSDASIFNYDRTKPYCSATRLKNTALEPFGDLLSLQWLFPPRISQDEHFELPPQYLEAMPILKDATCITHGAYGRIYKYNFPTGQLETSAPEDSVAVKVIVQKVDSSRQDLRREVEIMRHFRHEALAPLLASFEVQEEGKPLQHAPLYLVMPFATGGDMEDWIHRTSRPSFLRSQSRQEIQAYFVSQIQSLYAGLAFLHKAKGGLIVLHFDLRPRNILLFMEASSPVWKISDFGIAQLTRTDEPQRTHVDHNYAPPEAVNDLGIPANRLHGREFDVYSMACIALQLVTLAYEGWEGGAIEEFDYRRQGTTEDKSFRNSHSTLVTWIKRLKQADHQHVALIELLDLIGESLDPDPKRRPMAWEIPVYLQLSLSKELPYQYLGQAVPSSHLYGPYPISGPIDRAEHRGSPDLAKFLLQRGWSDPSLLHPRLQRHDSDIDASKYLSNLPTSFEAYMLKGKAPNNIVEKIDNAFRQNLEMRFAGLWGLGGMGKSHIAFTYAYQFRKKTQGVVPHHTFWINGSDQMKLDLSCQEIKTKIGCQEGPDLLLSIKAWLEDDSNGPWVLIVDGLDDIRYASELHPKLPRAKRGRTIITTRNWDVLIRFTRGKEAATIPVKDLPVEDARKIFDDIVKGCHSTYQPPTNKQFRELFNLVHTPLFVKWTAEYIIRIRGGPTEIGELIADLKTRISHVERLDFTNEQESKQERLYQIFSFFLCPFANSHDVSSEEFILLGTLACFSSDDLSFEAFKGLCETDGEARSYLGKYTSFSFISPRNPSTPGQHDYKMHDLVSEFILRYISQLSNSETKTMECFGWMLDRIFKMYCDQKRTIYQTEASQIRRDSFFWKRPFLSHFEEFSKYVHRLEREKGVDWQIAGWKCKPRIAQSIITFTKAFAYSNRIDDAIKLLQFVLNHGIESHKEGKEKYVRNVTIDVLNALATLLEDKRPGRHMRGFLEEALGHARNGLEMAKEADDPGRIWRISLQVTRILGRLDHFSEAAMEMKSYNLAWEELKLRLPETDRNKTVLERDMLLAHLLQQYGCAKRKKLMLVKSREILLRLIERVKTTDPLEMSLLGDLKLRLALVHSEIPNKSLLAQAYATYAESLQRRLEKFEKENTHSQIIDAKLNLAIVSIRQRDPAKAARTLQPIFDDLIVRCGEDDELTRKVAYTLVDAYTMRENQVAADQIKSRFKIRALDPTSRGGCFFHLGGDNNRVEEWSSDLLGINRFFGVRRLLLSTSEDLLLEREHDDIESID